MQENNLSDDMYVYITPAGFDNLLLSGRGNCLTGVHFMSGDGEAYNREKYGGREVTEGLKPAVRWLDIYFGGGQPDFLPSYQLSGVTPFRWQVADLLLTVPYGQTVTYGELARRLAARQGVEKMSARAVGQAVGWNPIGIMIPCHRVLGAGGRLTGYSGGMANKEALLKLEGCR